MPLKTIAVVCVTSVALITMYVNMSTVLSTRRLWSGKTQIDLASHHTHSNDFIHSTSLPRRPHGAPTESGDGLRTETIDTIETTADSIVADRPNDAEESAVDGEDERPKEENRSSHPYGRTAEVRTKRSRDANSSLGLHLPSSFPIGVVAYKRARLLRECLESLTNLTGLLEFDRKRPEETRQITVYQDGTHEPVKRVANLFDHVRLVQHKRPSRPTDGAVAIASHYRFVLSQLFDSNPTAPYVIVVEEDMVFSPDFLVYFSQLAHLYEDDPTIYCISSWNDNGFKGLASDNTVMYRTEFFIGLGWLVSRKIYQGEFEMRWPRTHWDHWMREPQRRKGRECVYPEVPRNFNIGIKGTHSDKLLYNKYFARIVKNTEPNVSLGDTNRLIVARYEAELAERLDAAAEIDGLKELEQFKGADIKIFYMASGPSDPIWETAIAPYFRLWHSVPHIRGSHRGMVQFEWHKNHIFLISSYSFYVRHKKASSPMLTRGAFKGEARPLPGHYRIIKGEPQKSCDQACASQSPPLRCELRGFEYINNCDALEKLFTCLQCRTNAGPDQPAYVFDRSADNFGSCLVNTISFSCDGSHAVTERACPCVSS